MTNPILIATPFAENGDKNVIPESTGANPQNATMQAGFPPITQQKISEGGIPPERNDFNGILNLYGQHIVHQNKGLPYEFDQAFADQIGGYPLGAELVLSDGLTKVFSTIPNNTTNPNTDLTNWKKGNDATDINYDRFQTVDDVLNKTVTPYDFGAIGKNLAAPVSDWYTIGATYYKGYTNLAEVQADFPHVTSATDYIDWVALQAWWSDISQNRRGKGLCVGEFICNKGIANTNTPSNLFKTKDVEFGSLIKFEGAVSRGFSILSARQCYFSGNFELHGSGGLVYENRQTDTLLYIQDCIQSKFDWFANIRYAKYWGLEVFSTTTPTPLNNNVMDLGKVQFASCGRRFSKHPNTFTARTDTGSSNSTGQRTNLTLGSGHGLDLTVGFINFNNRPYSIQSFTDTSLVVYPCLTETDTTGSIQINAGGDYRIYGQDSNMIRLNGYSSDCAICNAAMGFYVGKQDGRGNEFNDIGLCLGNGISNVSANGVWMGYYGEGNVFDIVKTSITDDKTILVNPIGQNRSKCFELLPIDLATRVTSPFLGSFPTWQEGDKTFSKKPYQFRDGTNPTTSITIDQTTGPFKLRANSPTITLSDNTDVRRLWALVDLEFEIFGTATNNGTSGVTTINTTAGYTVNGASSITIPANSAAIKVSARLVNGTDWRVSWYSAQKPTGSKTYDWPALGAGLQQSTTVNVTGAALGDHVSVSMNIAGGSGGTMLRGEVTSAGVVTVYQFNPTTASVDLASGTLAVRIL